MRCQFIDVMKTRQRRFTVLRRLTNVPAATGAWSTYPALEDIFHYNGSGVMPGRTWIIAPDAETLRRRWQTLIDAPEDQKEALFHPHLSKGKLGDRHIKKIVSKSLAGFPVRPR